MTPSPPIHACRHRSFSALHHAALNGNTELIALLLEAQAAVDIKDNKGKAVRDPSARAGVTSRVAGGAATEAPAQSLGLG